MIITQVIAYTGKSRRSMANDAWTTFKTIITDITDEVAPMKEARIKNRTDQWINNELLHQIEHRDNLLRQLTRRKDNAELRQE